MRTRIPRYSRILPVYAVIAALNFGWTISVFIWKLPSWLLNLTGAEILSIAAYSFAVNLLDSLLALALLLSLCAVLPKAWLKEHFVVRGTLISLCVLGSAMLHLYVNKGASGYDHFLSSMPVWWGLTAILTITLLAFSTKVGWLRYRLASISIRSVVFLYVLVPLSAISIIIVMLRNLL